MLNRTKQTLRQQQKQKLSLQQIQLMKLVQLSSLALEQRVKEELEENPALEEIDNNDDGTFEDSDYDSNEALGETWDEGSVNDESDNDESDSEEDRGNQDLEFDITDYIDDDDTPEYKLYVNNDPEESSRANFFTEKDSFRDRLVQQLHFRILTPTEQAIGEQIIGSLDDSGYLARPIASIANDLFFMMNLQVSEEEVLNVLEMIQDFEPSGVGARNLQECLLIQLRHKEQTPVVKDALKVVERFFEELSKKHYDTIIKRSGFSKKRLKSILLEILKLNPKPGGSSDNVSGSSQIVIPDFIITVNEGRLELALHNKNMPELRVSRDYTEMLDHYSKAKMKSKEDKEAVMFVRQKIDAARWFMDSIKQRYSTLELVMGAIMEYQKEYFLSGDETKLRPMRLKDIAEIVDMDISTISRVANSKYAQTHFGVFSVKSFFSESMENEEGESVSTREIQQILKECVEKEDKKHPLTDEKLSLLLKEKGYPVARRTVAKYREVLGIQPARLRKHL